MTGKLTTIVSAPLWKNGFAGSEVVGVIYLVPDENFLNDAMGEIKIGDTGYAYMLNKEGLTIATVPIRRMCAWKTPSRLLRQKQPLKEL